ncbi:hypothetical protein Cri9333_1391 [Crinalium epipsammum PCC 9333]|uniref:Uncharacterized protein n=1 Tax=Crinalium epipsammum PCC 9333 TaxID=1173022 RepID=K9VYP2_9CYAN|nr:hypothetical protein Cri9333_1391 [Crinalium epipsammum PCC 9333]
MNLSLSMKHFCEHWIQEWCEENGWTDLVIDSGNYWAFPPGAVMPEPIPPRALKLIKANKGFCFEEKLCVAAALVVSFSGSICAYVIKSPIPLVLAFSFTALMVPLLEVEEV